MLRQLGYGPSTVTMLWSASRVANAATLPSWGRISDRLSNGSVLAVAIPVYFACTLGFSFVPTHSSFAAQLAFLSALHVVMGAAGGGIGLATGNLGMKLAPPDGGTAYLAATGLVAAVAGGAHRSSAGRWRSGSANAGCRSSFAGCRRPTSTRCRS